MNSNNTNLIINDIENPKVSETFINKASDSINSPKYFVETLYLACDHHGSPRKHKEEAGDKPKAKRIHTDSTKDGCKTKIINTLCDGQKVQDEIWSRRPNDVKQWVVLHVDNSMDWKTINTLLRIHPQRLEELLEAGFTISSFPTSLRINYNDVQNVINAHSNKLSGRDAVDKTSVEEWMSFLKNEKCCIVHMKFHEGNGAYLLSWASPWQKKHMLGTADEWYIGSTSITNKGVPVCFFITDADSIEMGVLENVVWQSVQILSDCLTSLEETDIASQ
ncbi:hypothetical protein PHYBLDRAFT_151071 [Phycomyces blakesleeanus NRRL 1555(-)]|uniref:Uncharacterized protein n=1 Tax=Phycomyces blakesleeanus (strain ATCC 8743b / DSM 1359 / FGSC 10004 / NBRC 33097 / NRRL 1555) TaxID=763407 RepID=A0A167KFK1_PHYB8|nr:hypothetical protein PHYBLDRAFT_151071 [Phycomyces blakesleeanus NRRL 1555(-)]OAD67986.1 hypothetical protein PHYBLDRAFT_151071 [Phycomyces blakesleeanus NRRL 1555(-)]|eukprot:XP_018286026.1 hypothetical protein PHYBLDRAFT_151071 [Phycomyces blakesleeanus NRRL 1555(-)]